MPNKQPKIFFSNNLNDLAIKLYSQCFVENQRPTAKRIIAAPNHMSLECWLKAFFMQICPSKVAMGYSIVSLQGLFNHMLMPSEAEVLPDRHLIRKLSYKELTDLFNSNQCPKELSFLQKRYFQTKNIPFSFINSVTTDIYEKYIYNQRTFNNSWKDRLEQAVLSQLTPISHRLQNSRVNKDLTIGLFGFSSIPQEIFQYFIENKHNLNLNIYMYTPSIGFWGDMLSDKARNKTEYAIIKNNKKQQPLLEWSKSVSSDRLPILANLGSVSQSTLNYFLDYDLESIDSFHEIEGFSDLNQLQKNIFFASINESILSDGSVRIYILPTIIREVEELLINIYEILNIHKCTFKDICILSSNVSLYAPYIKSICSDLPIDIIGEQNIYSKILLEKLNLLLKVIHTDGETGSIYNLISHQSFIKRIEWDEESVRAIKKMIISSGVIGFNNTSTDEDVFNWNSFLQKTFALFPLFNDPMNNSRFLEALGSFSETIHILDQIIKQSGQKNECEDSEWIFLIIESLSSIFELSKPELDLLHKHIGPITKKQHTLCATSFSFIVESIKDGLLNETSYNLLLNDSIYFGPLQGFHQVPKKYTFLLGMNFKSPNEEADIYRKPPSFLEKTNQAILDIITSTSRMLIISYITSDATQEPMLGVVEIKKYLDAKWIFYKPRVSWNYLKNETKQNKLIPKPLSHYIEIAKTITKEHKSVFFKNSERTSHMLENKADLKISLNALMQCFSNPIEIFLKKTLKKTSLYTPRTSQQLCFGLSDKELIKSFRGISETNKPFFSKKFKTLAEENEREKFLLWKNAQKSILNGAEIKSILFSDIYINDQNIICSPSIHINSAHSNISIVGLAKEISENGIIFSYQSGSSKQQLILNNLPIISAILTSQDIISTDAIKIVNAFDIEKTPITIKLNNPKHFLSLLVSYYKIASNQPIPVFPHFIKDIINKDEDSLDKKIEQIFNEYSFLNNKYANSILFWMCNNKAKPSAKEIIINWHHLIKKLIPEEIYEIL